MPVQLPRYYTDMTCYELTTTILSIELRDGMTVVTLEDTIFHPQGGGQPADHGTIESATAIMQVTHVKKLEDGAIEHSSTMIEGSFTVGEEVRCSIDQAARMLHSRLHSAGHLLDVALDQLGLNWEAGKGYHFSDGPYVEYRTPTIPDADLAAQIEATTANLIAQNIPTKIELQGTNRIIHLGGKAVPCGGTHVQTLAVIGGIKIRNIKQKHGIVKIGYSVMP